MRISQCSVESGSRVFRARSVCPGEVAAHCFVLGEASDRILEFSYSSSIENSPTFSLGWMSNFVKITYHEPIVAIRHRPERCIAFP